jgi:hypothetical protein
MTKLIEQKRPLGQSGRQSDRQSDRQSARQCPHPLAIDKFEGIFGPQLRRLSCLVCGHGWWESNGAVIGSTSAVGVVAKLAHDPRPMGWAAVETEWRRLEDEGLAPGRPELEHAQRLVPG